MATIQTRPGNQPELPVIGSVETICKISLSASWSSGDIHLIGKIPVGAIMTGAVFYPGAALSGVAVAKFGTSASQEMFLASATYSPAALAYTSPRRLGTAMQISLSDEASPRFENLTMVATAGVSIGHVGDLIVRYRMPGQAL